MMLDGRRIVSGNTAQGRSGTSVLLIGACLVEEPSKFQIGRLSGVLTPSLRVYTIHHEYEGYTIQLGRGDTV